MKKLSFIHCSDLHLDSRLRIDDFKNSLDQISKKAIDVGVDFVIIAGDIYHKKNPNTETKVVFYEFISKLDKAQIPVFVLIGTHDVTLTHHNFSDLEILKSKRVILMDKIGIHGVGKVRILAVPHSNKGSDFVMKEISEICEKNNIPSKDTINILAGHFTVGGAKIPQSNYTIKDETQIPLEFLKKFGFDYIALGHIHKLQGLSKNIYYSGAIERINFGERENRPGYILWENGQIIVYRLKVRPMYQYDNISGGDCRYPPEQEALLKYIIEIEKGETKKNYKEFFTELKKRYIPKELVIEYRKSSKSEKKDIANMNIDFSISNLVKTWLNKEGYEEKNCLTLLSEIEKEV